MSAGSPRLPNRLAVVLSAGGPVAWMFHLGVLDAIEQSLANQGRDRSSIGLMIGTSAGSAVAAAFLGGAATTDIAEALMAPPTAQQRSDYASAIGGIRHQLGDRFRPLAPRMVRHALPGGRGIAFAMAGAMPRGVFPTTGLGDLPGIRDNQGWPDGLWIPSVDATTGQVVVFGRDVTTTSVADAVEASSAVPAMFSPKRIDQIDFVDGAVASSTHAALAAEIEPDLVLVSSVQTRPGNRPIRVGARRRLRAERNALLARGVRSVVIEPDDETTELATGFPRRGTTVAADLIERGRQLASVAIDALEPTEPATSTAEN